MNVVRTNFVQMDFTGIKTKRQGLKQKIMHLQGLNPKH